MTHKKDSYIFLKYRLSMRSIILCLHYLCRTLAIHSQGYMAIQSNMPPLITFRGCGTKHGNRKFRGFCAVLPDPIGACVSTMARPVFNKVESSETKMRNVNCTKCTTNARTGPQFAGSLCALPQLKWSVQLATCSAFIQSSRCPNPDSSTRSYCVQF